LYGVDADLEAIECAVIAKLSLHSGLAAIPDFLRLALMIELE
jgi:hypothetical protein